MNSIDYTFICDIISMLNFVKSSFKFNNEFPYSFNIVISNRYNKKYIKQEVEETCNSIINNTFAELDIKYRVSEVKEKDDKITIVFSLPVEEAYFNVTTI